MVCRVEWEICGDDDFVLVVFIGVIVAKFVVSCCCCVALKYGDLGSPRMMFVLEGLMVPCVIVCL